MASADVNAGAMRQVPVNILRKFLSLDEETGQLFWKPRDEEDFAGAGWQKKRACKTWNTRFAGKEAAAKTTGGYLQISIYGVHLKAHRVITAILNGEWPSGEIDHVNGVTSDNRPCNLRVLSHSTNLKNQKLRSTNTSGHMGIRIDRRRNNFVVTIWHDGDRRHIGCYSEEKDALIARKAAERALNYHPNHGRSGS